VLILLALLTLVAAGTAQGSKRTDRLKHSVDVVRFFDNHSWMVASRKKKCSEVPWRKSCKIARKLVEKHEAVIDSYTLPNTDNWTRAMRIAQRVVPGTLDWLSFISNRECRACYTVPGGFICNYQGSGACGPMQFMSGTFYGYVDAARAFVSAQGFVVADEVWSWDNPLGQALTAGYMRYTGQDGCHWC
jgi:hypothetical protein